MIAQEYKKMLGAKSVIREMFTYGTERAKEEKRMYLTTVSVIRLCRFRKVSKENDRTAGDGKPGSPSWIQPEPRYRQCA